jgi:hypothetical protein
MSVIQIWIKQVQFDFYSTLGFKDQFFWLIHNYANGAEKTAPGGIILLRLRGSLDLYL